MARANSAAYRRGRKSRKIRMSGAEDASDPLNIEARKARIEQVQRTKSLKSSFDMKRVCDKYDLLEYYEKVRFTPAYRAYIAMDWWPFVDWLATYGHLFNNSIFVIVAIYQNISLYMLFHMTCVCLFYAQATIKLNRRAL